MSFLWDKYNIKSEPYIIWQHVAYWSVLHVVAYVMRGKTGYFTSINWKALVLFKLQLRKSVFAGWVAADNIQIMWL